MSFSICDVRDQRNLAGALERRLQLALVHRTRARDPARQDLPALRHERAQQLYVVYLVRAELSDLAAAENRPALALLFVCVFLVAAAAATATTRASLSECHD